MPIKPENQDRYPANWPVIRVRMMARARNRCEWPGCGLGHGWVGYRDDSDKFVLLAQDGRVEDVADLDGKYAGFKVVRIVLTCAHLDHTPEHCEPENLRIWCQRHHLRYDLQHHQQTAYMTRKAKAQTQDLFTMDSTTHTTTATADTDDIAMPTDALAVGAVPLTLPERIALIDAGIRDAQAGAGEPAPAVGEATNELTAHALLTRLRPFVDSIICYASTPAEYAPNRLAADVEEYFRHPSVAPAPTNVIDELLAAIMNLPCKVPEGLLVGEAGLLRRGHRDARHAAAELLAGYTSLPEPLRPKRLPLDQQIETIAREWDGCLYEAPGQAIDIGAAIRRRAATITME